MLTIFCYKEVALVLANFKNETLKKVVIKVISFLSCSLTKAWLCTEAVFLVRMETSWERAHSQLGTSSQCFSHITRSQLGTSSLSNRLKIRLQVKRSSFFGRVNIITISLQSCTMRWGRCYPKSIWSRSETKTRSRSNRDRETRARHF